MKYIYQVSPFRVNSLITDMHEICCRFIFISRGNEQFEYIQNFITLPLEMQLKCNYKCNCPYCSFLHFSEQKITHLSLVFRSMGFFRNHDFVWGQNSLKRNFCIFLFFTVCCFTPGLTFRFTVHINQCMVTVTYL